MLGTTIDYLDRLMVRIEVLTVHKSKQWGSLMESLNSISRAEKDITRLLSYRCLPCRLFNCVFIFSSSQMGGLHVEFKIAAASPPSSSPAFIQKMGATHNFFFSIVKDTSTESQIDAN